jgi:hypothetical protein
MLQLRDVRERPLRLHRRLHGCAPSRCAAAPPPPLLPLLGSGSCLSHGPAADAVNASLPSSSSAAAGDFCQKAPPPPFPGWGIAVIVVGGFLLLAAAAALAVVVRRERRGEPLFMRLDDFAAYERKQRAAAAAKGIPLRDAAPVHLSSSAPAAEGEQQQRRVPLV